MGSKEVMINDIWGGQPQFSGKLSNEQLVYLKEHGLSDKRIERIQSLLSEYKEGITDYVDLVGDDLLPGAFFLHNMKHYGHLLALDPEKTFSERQNKIRAKVMIPIIQSIGKNFLHSKQIFENRNELLAYSKRKAELEDDGFFHTIEDNELVYENDPGIYLPDEPVIWTLNHSFKDDVLASVLSVSRPFTMFFGSVPQFYNTFDGVLAYNIGSIIVNRKSKKSRRAGLEKAKMAVDMGLDILMSPEGVWNKNPHKLLEHFWPGIYMMAKETNSKVVPIVHYIFDPTQRIPKKNNPIHTVIDDPIDITYMPEKEALEYYRDVMATWYYIMMEKYGSTTREELTEGYSSSAEAYEDVMLAMMDTVDRYDTEFERTITYRPKGVIHPEDVFEAIANIEPNSKNYMDYQYAKQLVATRKKENYQRRF